ncbi:hypothetical protein DFJ73DRAFT_167067 [Zopfochytrium polystomum]|nr:hypothetical protein DFJ73DRAFT_167067 [Zopfochytrium polystomum]
MFFLPYVLFCSFSMLLEGLVVSSGHSGSTGSLFFTPSRLRVNWSWCLILGFSCRTNCLGTTFRVHRSVVFTFMVFFLLHHFSLEEADFTGAGAELFRELFDFSPPFVWSFVSVTVPCSLLLSRRRCCAARCFRGRHRFVVAATVSLPCHCRSAELPRRRTAAALSSLHRCRHCRR